MFLALTLALTLLLWPVPRRRFARRRSTVDEHEFYLAIHNELRSGASLRNAIADAAQGHGALDEVCQSALSTAPLDQVADALGSLPELGRTASLATQVAAQSGGRAAQVFLRLADRARSQADLARQKRALATQARLSAAVVASLPLLWVVLGGAGRLQTMVVEGGAAIAVAGFGMEALGVVLIWRMASS